jgi:hypothetical protein
VSLGNFGKRHYRLSATKPVSEICRAISISPYHRITAWIFSTEHSRAFTTKLLETIQLEGDYEVELAKIIYPHSWYNLDDLTRRYWIGVKSEGLDIRPYYIKSGIYADGTVFTNELTNSMPNFSRILPILQSFQLYFSHKQVFG